MSTQRGQPATRVILFQGCVGGGFQTTHPSDPGWQPHRNDRTFSECLPYRSRRTLDGANHSGNWQTGPMHLARSGLGFLTLLALGIQIFNSP